VRNTFIIFVVSGFWHGANWTFIVWGALNALYFLPLLLARKNRTHLDPVAENRILPSLREVWQMASTFALTVLAWVFFRAEDMAHAITYLKGIFSTSLFTVPRGADFTGAGIHPLVFFSLLCSFLIIEWLGRKHLFAIQKITTISSVTIRSFLYYLIIVSIFFFGGKNQEFIYFQF
jgi:hypothetical protein